jgi:hypothetical protein
MGARLVFFAQRQPYGPYATRSSARGVAMEWPWGIRALS